MEKINVKRISKRNNILGQGQAKTCFDAIDKVVKIPFETDLSKTYNIKRIKHFANAKDLRKAYCNLEQSPFRWRVKSFIIEKFIFDKIQEIGKKYKIDITMFLPILKFYYNDNNIPVIVNSKVDKVCSFNEAIEETNTNKEYITNIINTVGEIMEKEYNIKMYLYDIFESDGNCGIINNCFTIIDYGYGDIIYK